jgi:hypothetical protein
LGGIFCFSNRRNNTHEGKRELVVFKILEESFIDLFFLTCIERGLSEPLHTAIEAKDKGYDKEIKCRQRQLQTNRHKYT